MLCTQIPNQPDFPEGSPALRVVGAPFQPAQVPGYSQELGFAWCPDPGGTILFLGAAQALLRLRSRIFQWKRSSSPRASPPSFAQAPYSALKSQAGVQINNAAKNTFWQQLGVLASGAGAVGIQHPGSAGRCVCVLRKVGANAGDTGGCVPPVASKNKKERDLFCPSWLLSKCHLPPARPRLVFVGRMLWRGPASCCPACGRVSRCPCAPPAWQGSGNDQGSHLDSVSDHSPFGEHSAGREGC